jgi:hypothetical protein
MFHVGKRQRAVPTCRRCIIPHDEGARSVLPRLSLESSTCLLGRVGDLLTISGEKPVEWDCEELWTRELPGLHKNQAGDPSHAALPDDDSPSVSLTFVTPRIDFLELVVSVAQD